MEFRKIHQNWYYTVQDMGMGMSTGTDMDIQMDMD
jgi:hypothetical protein